MGKLHWFYYCSADEIIAIKNTSGPLGIHVVPHYDNSGR